MAMMTPPVVKVVETLCLLTEDYQLVQELRTLARDFPGAAETGVVKSRPSETAFFEVVQQREAEKIVILGSPVLVA